MATIPTPREVRLVPSECVLPFFYVVFNLCTAIANRNYLVCFKVRVGHNKSDTRKKFSYVPLYLTNNLPGLIPALRLVIKLDHPNLYPALWWTTDSASRSVEYAPLQTVVAGKPDEVSDPLLFAKLL